jgi:hypothetical protein
MNWVAATEKDTTTNALETRLWSAADQFRTNSGLESQEYAALVSSLEGDLSERDHDGKINSALCFPSS